MWLIAIDDLVFAEWDIPPAMLTNQSSHLGFGVDRRPGLYSSVFFGATAQPATWHVIVQTPTDAARHALIAALSTQRSRPFRLLAQREAYGEDLVTIEAAVSGSIDQRSAGAFGITFESNDSVWLAETIVATTKTFVSARDQMLSLPALGNVPTHPVVRLTPGAQRAAPTAAVGWRHRRRYAVSNGADEPLVRYPVAIPLGDTAALVSAGKARADGADLRVWLHGLEQARSLVGWNTTATALWVIVPALPSGQSLTYDVVYGNALATDADGVELVYPDRPAFDMALSSNYLRYYHTATDVANAGLGLWRLSSSLEGGSADYEVPGAWRPALTWENPNNDDNYVQPRAERISEDAREWYQARLYAARWRGPGFDDYDAYAGSDPFDGVTLFNPFGIRSVHADGFSYRNNASIKTVVTTTVAGTTESSEVLVPRDPPFTRAVAIARNSGGEGWHVLEQYGGATAVAAGLPVRLYLPSSGGSAIFPAFASGWEDTSGADRLAAVSGRGATATGVKSVTLGTTAADDDVLLRQYVYPLPENVAFKTTDTVKGQIRARESVSGADARAQIVVRVMTGASIVRATLLDFDTAILSSEFDTSDTYVNRKFPRGGAVALAANYTSVAGDYLVIELGARKHATTGATLSLVFGEEDAGALPLGENETDTAFRYPWIEFSTDLTGSIPSIATAWTPPRPMKHFGLACWPQGVVSIPEEAESRVLISSTGDMRVHLAAESLLITPTEAETEIYELATELRVRGGANAAGPYHAVLIGNARQVAGPGAPRAALALGTQALEVDAEQHTHAVWDGAFSGQQELLSTHAVRALVGALREVDATDIPAMQRIAQTIPNAAFAANLTGWETEQTDGDWTYAVTHDSAVGGAANGSMKFAVTVADAGLVLHRGTTFFAVQAMDSVEVSAWLRQTESGASSPRIGVIWYDGSAVALATDLDRVAEIALNPSIDHRLAMSAVAPAGATQFRVVLGVTAFANAPATKWFDDVTATIVRPIRYDAQIAKVNDETPSSQWLPLVPPRRTVANGGFDAGIGGWELHLSETGITQTASHDATMGGAQTGSLKIAITANTGGGRVVYLHSPLIGRHGLEAVSVGAWVRTDTADIQPLLAVAWYDGAALVSLAVEADWAPAAATGYGRTFAAIAPPGADGYRLGIVADTVAASATGAVWFDDITLNDNNLFVSDVAISAMEVTALVRPRWAP